MEFSIREGESRTISEKDIVVRDADTAVTDINFIIKTPPKYGKLRHFGNILTSGDTFTYSDILDFR